MQNIKFYRNSFSFEKGSNTYIISLIDSVGFDLVSSYGYGVGASTYRLDIKSFLEKSLFITSFTKSKMKFDLTNQQIETIKTLLKKLIKFNCAY